MIFGTINLNKNGPLQYHVLEKIYEQLSWSGCQEYDLISGSFAGCYFIDNRLPFNISSNFYIDYKSGNVVLLDGFIYNEKELLSILDIGEEVINSPELILKAYEKWGIEFSNNLNGDFVIMLYFPGKSQVYLITDHLGNRPAAFTIIDSVLYFGTDVMGLSKALFKNEKIYKDFLFNIFLREAFDYSILPNKQIKKLNPGHYLLYSPEHQQQIPYWYPEQIRIDNTLKFSNVSNDLREILFDAVAIRADHQYKASAHISGGIDSGIVAALSRKYYSSQPDFYGFSWSPEIKIKNKNLRKDERQIVKRFCQLNNIIPKFTNYNEEDYLAYLSNWRYPSEYLYERKTIKSAGKKGINLIFSGWGGDEFISIGDIGIDAELIRGFNWRIFLKKYPPGNLRKFLSALFYKGFFPDLKASYLKYKSLPSIFPYIEENLHGNILPRNKRFSFKTRRAFHIQMIKKFALAARTADWYVNGQRNGIEYRYPLLDKRIIEYMLKVPSRCLAEGNSDRIILRTIGKEFLPKEILNGRKNDPYNFYHFKSVTKNVELQLLEEIEIYKCNPDLNFINFRLLEENIKKLRKYGDKSRGSELLILHYLKKAHEFTKGYYN